MDQEDIFNMKRCNRKDNCSEIGKNCCPLAIIGPTGPQGPATIAVGTTQTAEPGSPASVTNSGTNENVILNFNIPSGATGPTGPQGLAGGTNSVSAHLVIMQIS